jgi:hypothetical protein
MHEHEIHFFVNGVRHSTDRHELLAEEILRIAGFNSEHYKLVRTDKPDTEIAPGELVHLHDEEKFLALKKSNEFSDIGGMSDLEQYFSERLGFTTEHVSGTNGDNVVIKSVVVPGGILVGKTCDIAIASTKSVPFNPLPYFHTRPALVANGNGTAAGQISSDWQYWSRKWDSPPRTPEEVWAWLLTALTQAV